MKVKCDGFYEGWEVMVQFVGRSSYVGLFTINHENYTQYASNLLIVYVITFKVNISLSNPAHQIQLLI